MNISMEDFFDKCVQTHSELWVGSNLLNKSLYGTFIFCAVEYSFKHLPILLHGPSSILKSSSAISPV